MQHQKPLLFLTHDKKKSVFPIALLSFFRTFAEQNKELCDKLNQRSILASTS